MMKMPGMPSLGVGKTKTMPSTTMGPMQTTSAPFQPRPLNGGMNDTNPMPFGAMPPGGRGLMGLSQMGQMGPAKAMGAQMQRGAAMNGMQGPNFGNSMLRKLAAGGYGGMGQLTAEQMGGMGFNQRQQRRFNQWQGQLGMPQTMPAPIADLGPYINRPPRAQVGPGGGTTPPIPGIDAGWTPASQSPYGSSTGMGGVAAPPGWVFGPDDGLVNAETGQPWGGGMGRDPRLIGELINTSGGRQRPKPPPLSPQDEAAWMARYRAGEFSL
jgi:hypothetical protein